MARLTVSQIMVSIAASVNQEATEPTVGGDEWDLWLEFINRAVNEWAEATQWEDLRKAFRPTVSGLTQATIVLPTDFRTLARSPILHGTSRDSNKEWPEILPEQRFLYDSTDDYFEVKGNIDNGFNLIWNPGTLSSGASITIEYFSTPTSLASPAQIPIVPDSQFLVDRTVAYVWEVRSDPRFQQQETKARDRLLLMIENHNLDKYSSFAGANPVMTSARRQGFRIGRDG